MIPELIKGHGRATGSFRYCLRYVLRPAAHACIIGTNMIEETPSRLSSEFEFITPASGKGKDLVFHYALSFAPEDVPKLKDANEGWRLDLLREIGERSLNLFGEIAESKRGKRREIGLGTEDNQYLLIFHPPLESGDLPHLHIVANRARFDGQLCYCSWSKNDLHSAAAEIEAEFDLRRCDHGKSKREQGKEKSQEKDSRELSARQLKRLEKKEQRKGETDPRLAAYREMISLRQQQLLEPLRVTDAECVVKTSPCPHVSVSACPLPTPTEMEPTLHQKKEPPLAQSFTPRAVEPAQETPQNLSSKQRLQVAEQYALTLWLIFQRAKVLGKATEIAPGRWVYQDKGYGFGYNESLELFTLAHIERGLLARYQSRKLLAVGKIEPEDIEAFAKYEESRTQPLASVSIPSKPQRGKSPELG